MCLKFGRHPVALKIGNFKHSLVAFEQLFNFYITSPIQILAPWPMKFAVLKTDGNFLYIFGGHFATPNFLWMYDISKKEWTKIRILNIDGLECFQWNNGIF